VAEADSTRPEQQPVVRILVAQPEHDLALLPLCAGRRLCHQGSAEWCTRHVRFQGSSRRLWEWCWWWSGGRSQFLPRRREVGERLPEVRDRSRPVKS